jgi:hypothetical protein
VKVRVYVDCTPGVPPPNAYGVVTFTPDELRRLPRYDVLYGVGTFVDVQKLDRPEAKA